MSTRELVTHAPFGKVVNTVQFDLSIRKLNIKPNLLQILRLVATRVSTTTINLSRPNNVFTIINQMRSKVTSKKNPIGHICSKPQRLCLFVKHT